MRQLNYRFDTVDGAIRGLAAIAADMGQRPHTDALVHVFTSGVESAELVRLTQALDGALPGVKRVGMTEFTMDAEDQICEVRLNLLLAERAAFVTLQLPCEPGMERQSANALRDAMRAAGAVKGVELFPANQALDVSLFLEAASRGFEHVPFFGAMAMSARERAGTSGEDSDARGIGEALLKSGFTVALYCGDDLQLYMDYILGWHPIGREMDIVIGRRSCLGESCIEKVDGQPALEIYRKYLGVGWDENFVLNICEFPLMVRRNGADICMIPLLRSESGKLYFSGRLNQGEKIRFSYATREEVLNASRKGSERMARFDPEAVFMTLCGNRTIFLGGDADREWEYYADRNPALAHYHGHYEISYIGGRGGILNSAIVAVGMREHGAPADMTPYCPREQCVCPPGPIPLSYRMSRFFHVMTDELIHLEKNLESEVDRKTRENESLALHVVETLADAIDAKDTYTNGHSRRVAMYAREIARQAGYSESRQEHIYVMGLLHDVGKIGVPDEIINKPGRLTDGEFEKIKTHPVLGNRILGKITEMPDLAVGAHWHHERYDGRGYPDGLKGDEIPESARIIAVADAYDAMTSSRSYRKVLAQDIVRGEIEKGRGTQFDPRFADIMLDMIDADTEYRMHE